jgi:hypothetical protein
MISDERCGKALTYLANTDEDAAELKVVVARKEYLLELARKSVYLNSEGTVENRKAKAELSNEVGFAMDEYLEAMLSHEKVKAKRLTEALIVETWRSVNANRRVGNV